MPRNHFKLFNELVSIAFLKGPVNQEKIGESPKEILPGPALGLEGNLDSLKEIFSMLYYFSN